MRTFETIAGIALIILGTATTVTAAQGRRFFLMCAGFAWALAGVWMITGLITS